MLTEQIIWGKLELQLNPMPKKQHSIKLRIAGSIPQTVIRLDVSHESVVRLGGE